MYRLVAVVGLPGAGKSEVVAVFENAGFTKIYFGSLTIEKLQEAGLEITENNERTMREQLRAEHGMAAYATLNIPKIAQELKIGDVVIDGLYSWQEYLVLTKEFPNIKVLAVYAPPHIRYQRLAKRPVRPLSAAAAISRDHSQIEQLHQAGPIAMAHFTLINIGSMKELRAAVRQIIDDKKT